MNIFKTIALAICAALITTFASAVEKRIGVSAAYMMFSTDGSETLRQSSNVTNKSVDEEVLVPSIFFEVVGDSGYGLGVDYVPVAELGSGTGDDDDAETSGANKASAELASHVTVYALAQADNGGYFKLGMAMADVDTTETLATGDTYGNTDTTGIMVAVGRSVDKGTHFIRGDLSYTDYDDVSITSTGGSVVKADGDSVALTFSIGKSF